MDSIDILKKDLSSKEEANLKKSYVELLSFFNIISKEQYDRIPKKLIDFFEENKDESYEKVVYKNVPISKQNLMQETLDLIAFLNIKYWCDDKEEIIRLRKIYMNN